ncbi:MAG: PatB family C-S lyase [Pseudomonadota bacterium]
MFDFDQIIDRRGTAAKKWDKFAGRDMLPFWIADMDFPTPPDVQAALQARLDHGILGYAQTPDGLSEQVAEWLANNGGYRPRAEHMIWLPGVVPGLNLAAIVLARSGGAVAMATPVYYPFRSTPQVCNQRSVEVPLVLNGARWEMDFARLEAAFAAESVTSFLLSNPQNPTGRAYTREELTRLAEIALRHDVWIISDEIHSPLVIDERCEHISIAGLDPEIARRTVTLHAMTKAYNLAGLNAAVAVIEDDAVRQRFADAREGLVSLISPLAFTGAQAAYGDSSDYLPQLRRYLQRNHAALNQCVAGIEGVTTTPVEATYLSWLDVRELELAAPGEHFEAHGLALSDGAEFGGPGFVRFNFAAPASVVAQGLARLQRACDAAQTAA